MRFHNIFGPFGTYDGGREKAPAAMCRKVAAAKDGGSIEIWGDGEQTRSFCYMDDCVEGMYRLMRSDYREPLNLGTEEIVTINQLANKVIAVSGKNGINLKHVDGPMGVRGRNSDNSRLRRGSRLGTPDHSRRRHSQDLPLDREAGAGHWGPMRLSFTSKPGRRWRSPITGGFDLVPKLSEASVLVSDKVSRWPRGVWQVRHAGVQAYRGVCLLCTHKVIRPISPPKPGRGQSVLKF